MKLEEELRQNDDDVIAERIEFQLHLLDEAHARARGPKARRKIEAKIVELKAEALKLAVKVVDIAYARWVRSLENLKL
jgi:hypothetical protein